MRGVSAWVMMTCAVLLCGAAAGSELGRVELGRVTRLSVDRGAWTLARRTAPRRQLECVGGGCDMYEAMVARLECDRDVSGTEWMCSAGRGSALPVGVTVTDVGVVCEGWDGPGDAYVLEGSCAVSYGLRGVPRTASARDPYVRREARDPWDPMSGRHPKRDAGVDGVLALAGFMIVVAVLVGVLCLPGGVAQAGRTKAGGAGGRPRERPGAGGGSRRPGWAADWDVQGWWNTGVRYLGPVLRYIMMSSLMRRSGMMMGGRRGVFGGMGSMRRPGMYGRRF